MAKTLAAQAKHDAKAQHLAWRTDWETAPAVTNVDTGAQQTYRGLSPFQAVMAAYAQERQDWNTWNYAAAYGHLVHRTTGGVVCGGWWAYQEAAPRATPAQSAALRDQAMDAAMWCDLVEETQGKEA